MGGMSNNGWVLSLVGVDTEGCGHKLVGVVPSWWVWSHVCGCGLPIISANKAKQFFGPITI